MNRYRFFSNPVLASSFFAAIAMAATEAPLWITLIAAIFIFWKWASEVHSLPIISKKVTGLMSVFLVGGVFMVYGTILGQEASNAMLIGLSALKVVDYDSKRDHRFIVLLGFVMAAVKAIFTLDIYWAIPSALCFVGFWYSLLQPGIRKPSHFLTSLLVASLPLTLIIFFVFPRVVLPWAQERASKYASTGFTDRLSPGGIADLANDDRLAFRAYFFDKTVHVEDLYWRGAVLVESQGLQWRTGVIPDQGRPEPSSEAHGEEAFWYEVALEPYGGAYLFTLDHPRAVKSEQFEVEHVGDSVYRQLSRFDSVTPYRVLSHPKDIDAAEPAEDYFIPPELSPRVQAWVDGIAKEYSTSAGRFEQLSEFFKSPDFIYTMRPDQYLGEDPLGDFLFERKRGFCEHFAGSFASLARALGIASRVVVGYQGGKHNFVGDFWKVSQMDAHAWTELYLNGRWQRVDPTQWIAPLRLRLGAHEFFAMPEDEQIRLARSMKSPKTEIDFTEAISLWIDSLNYKWSYFLLEFDSEIQKGFWVALKNELELINLLRALLAVGLLIFILFGLRRMRLRRSPLEMLLESVFRWAAKNQKEREACQPVYSYLKSLEKEFPAQAESLSKIAGLYDRVSFQEQKLSSRELRRVNREWRRESGQRIIPELS